MRGRPLHPQHQNPHSHTETRGLTARCRKASPQESEEGVGTAPSCGEGSTSGRWMQGLERERWGSRKIPAPPGAGPPIGRVVEAQKGVGLRISQARVTRSLAAAWTALMQSVGGVWAR